MTNSFLIGEKVYLRPLEREDAASVQPWFNDPEVNRFLLAYRPLDLRGEEQFIDTINKSDTDMVLMIVRLDVDQPVGVTGLHRCNHKNRNAVFGITIGDKHAWGEGFGSEATKLMMQYAFETLNLHRVTLQVFDYNERGIHIYEKLGFKREGVMREENYRDGRYHDTVMMGLLRSDWDAARETKSDE